VFRIDNAGDLVNDKSRKGTVKIPPFAMVTTSEGKYYSYSPYGWKSLAVNRNIDPGKPFDLILHNGKWKHYQTVFTPNGSDFETFVLPMVRSEMDE